ncbi:MAG: PIG-L deacetylase family protein, partial [Frankia sp.]
AVPPDEIPDRMRAAGHAAKRRQRVLAVGAHPDDVEIGVAGILIANRAAGNETAVLTLTCGAEGGERAERAREARAAAEHLGAELYLRDLTDTEISEGQPTVAVIEEVIEAFDPTIVYTHSVHDNHQDHRNTSLASTVACRKVPRLYCYQSPSATVDFRPTLFVGIDDYLDGKMKAIETYSSQYAIREYLEPDLIRATARYWGRLGPSRYAESLEVVRDRTGVVGADHSESAEPAVRGRGAPGIAPAPGAGSVPGAGEVAASGEVPGAGGAVVDAAARTGETSV